MPASHPSNGPERRTDVRCVCQLLASSDSFSGRVTDISEHGLGLILNQRLDKGTCVTVNLWRSDEAFLGTMTVKVVRVQEHGQGEWLHGCISQDVG
ncbi:MAG: hypothetical protein KatS3mg105_1404 [Gemmatales bacterium]|nr:MAG: hypothetical protein KatS3mg105_1404 [Gemmatales bacterium]